MLHQFIKHSCPFFPKSGYKEYDSFFGAKGKNGVVGPVVIRGLHGFIPIKTASIVQLNDTVSATCFLVYLCSKGIIIDTLIGKKLSGNPDNAKILLQVMFNPSNGTFLGKPDNFPLEGTDWICLGDACNTLSIVEFGKVEAAGTTCFMLFEKQLASRYLQVFRYEPGNIQSSAFLPTGSLGGESGCAMEIEYRNVTGTNEGVAAEKRTFCDTACQDICQSRGLRPGETSERIIILKREPK